MFLHYIILTGLFIYGVHSEECVTYTFEEGFLELFNDNEGVCSVVRTFWEEKPYALAPIDPPNNISTTYISPLTTLSCVSSFNFLMSGEGVVEFLVYMSGDSSTDQLSILASQYVAGGNENVVGSIFIHPGDVNFVRGWSKQRMTIIGSGTFEGYVSFMGMGSADSLILIDSFRYIPPGMDEDSCVIYQDITESTLPPTIETTIESTTLPITTELTTESTAQPTTETTGEPITTEFTTETTAQATTETTGQPTTETTGQPITTEFTTETTAQPTTETTGQPTTETTGQPITTEFTTETTAQPTTETTTESEYTTTQQPDAIEECVTYNFETDFDVLFSPDNYLCAGLLSWQLENYTSVDIGSPNPESTVFMTPHEAASCISSFVFKMEPGGIVEANVFMEQVQDMDHIIIIAQRVTDREYDTVAGFIKYHPGNPVFVTGWNVIRFTLLDITSFNGYLLFIGGANNNATVLVDSIRYIPPLTSPDDASCNFY